VGDAGLDNKVTFLGFVQPEELRKITREAYIGINLVEHIGLSYYYSLSNKFFDYIHAGVPQVCIDFPEYRKLNERFSVALLTKDCSVTAITMAVNELLTGKNIYSQLQKNCEVCRQALNWQAEENKLLNFYERIPWLIKIPPA